MCRWRCTTASTWSWAVAVTASAPQTTQWRQAIHDKRIFIYLFIRGSCLAARQIRIWDVYDMGAIFHFFWSGKHSLRTLGNRVFNQFVKFWSLYSGAPPCPSYMWYRYLLNTVLIWIHRTLISDPIKLIKKYLQCSSRYRYLPKLMEKEKPADPNKIRTGILIKIACCTYQIVIKLHNLIRSLFYT